MTFCLVLLLDKIQLFSLGFPSFRHILVFLSRISSICLFVAWSIHVDVGFSYFSFLAFIIFLFAINVAIATTGCCNWFFFAIFNLVPQVLGVMHLRNPQFWRVLFFLLFLTLIIFLCDFSGVRPREGSLRVISFGDEQFCKVKLFVFHAGSPFFDHTQDSHYYWNGGRFKAPHFLNFSFQNFVFIYFIIFFDWYVVFNWHWHIN